MITNYDHTEANIDILNQAIKKYQQCKHASHTSGQKACAMFHHAFDDTMDTLAHCGSCKLNTKKPNNKLNVRFY